MCSSDLVEINAFKAQQRRWAKGVMQVGWPDIEKDHDTECLDRLVAEIQQMAGA